jgi:outer membrane receptor protein involved in Fe transport
LELLNWDLDDIARIEIVRGPGSVTYGPGAIAGVINIYTKTARQSEGLELGSKYWNRYHSMAGHVSYGQYGQDNSFYCYLSGASTEGANVDIFGADKKASGYIGVTPGLQGNRPAARYMTDFAGEPQIKAHIDMKLKGDWRIWGRYVTSSSELMQGTATQYLIDGIWQDFRQTRYRYGQLTAENHSTIYGPVELATVLAASSIDVHNVEKWDKSIDNDRDSLQNIGWIWSEHEFMARWMLNYQPDDRPIKAAVGLELSYDMIRPAWGKDKDDGLRLADGIISGPTSDAYGTGYRQITESDPKYFAVGEGWETVMFSILSEVNLDLSPQTTAVVSGRLDKHEYTDYMFSPRLALLQHLAKDDYLKLVLQRSVRMNTQEELYMSQKMGQDNDPETLETAELIYTTQLTNSLGLQTSVFLNRNEVIAWDWNQRRAAPVGELKTAGVEIDAQYKKEGLVFGINHAYVKQLDWELAEGLLVSGISYSDYYHNAGSGVIIQSNGNDLNNWPNHITKLYGHLDLLDGKLGLHGDLRFIWGLEGSEDGLDALDKALAAASGTDAYRAMIDNIRQHDAYKLQATADLSLTYRFSKQASVTLYIQNISVIGDNKRYAYSSGFKNPYPDKVSWVEEPTIIGIAGLFRFK